jgi:hypothetical protein
MPAMILTAENGERVIINTRNIIGAAESMQSNRKEAGIWELRLNGAPQTICIILKDEKAIQSFASVLADPDSSAYVETI